MTTSQQKFFRELEKITKARQLELRVDTTLASNTGIAAIEDRSTFGSLLTFDWDFVNPTYLRFKSEPVDLGFQRANLIHLTNGDVDRLLGGIAEYLDNL